MFGNLKLRDRALLGYSIPTGLIFIFSGMVYFTATKISETFKQVETTQSTLLEVKSMNVNMVNMERRVKRSILIPGPEATSYSKPIWRASVEATTALNLFPKPMRNENACGR